MTLFSDESSILEEVPIDYENKVAIYDDYCDDMYAIKNNDNHEMSVETAPMESQGFLLQLAGARLCKERV